MLQSPCYTCDKCPCKNHDGCPDYVEYKTTLEKIRKDNIRNAEIKDYVNQSIIRTKRKYGR